MVVICVINDGIFNWILGGVYQIQCLMDVIYYFFDIQVCSVIFFIWGYISIEIIFNSIGVDLFYYEFDGEWEFIFNSVMMIMCMLGQNSMLQVFFEMIFK